MDNIQLLISGYLDDELADEQIERLVGLLRTDANAVDRLVLAGFVHSQLNDWMNQQRVQDNAMGRAVTMADWSRPRTNFDESIVPVEDLYCECPDLAEEPNSAAGGWRFWPRSLASRAAALLVAVGIVFAAYTIASRPVIVAQMTQAAACQWDSNQTNASVGALLESGQELKLVRGRALITFVNGAQMLLEGPSTLRLDSASEVRLVRGFVATKVPTQAIGFAVSTSLARFVDLGTEFTLQLDADKAFDLYVFEGLVELQVDERFGEKVHQPLRVAEVFAVHFDTQAPDVVPLPFNKGEKMPF